MGDKENNCGKIETNRKFEMEKIKSKLKIDTEN